MQRILVKAAPGLSETKLTFGATAVPFEVEPLFKSIGSQSAFGAAADDIWYVLKPKEAVDEKNPWDLCHRLMQQGFGVVGAAPPKFAEPDIEQKWITGSPAEAGQSLVQSCDVRDPQNPAFPVNTDNYWFRDATHSQFDAALAAIGGPDVASKVRIAHFDTGYDPHHHSLPKRLRRDIARNFVDDGNPNDASDQTTGLLTNLGHGTGTLSILAGTSIPPATALGGAPFAEVVPVRVANRVVLFSNSAIAKAFDYVHELNVAGTRVDIITMSMGGLASQAWADAVNALYEQGVFIVTAAGNNFGNLPTHNVVYPARFNRVVAACGVMADGRPYADLASQLMAGNYGPTSKMTTAIAASTPNVPWARLGCPNMVDFNGAGTSAATPQVAAAAAIWLQWNRAVVDAYPEGWMRVEAIRKALFETARRSQINSQEIDRHLGRGKLSVNDALSSLPGAASVLRKTASDTAALPILRILTGLGLQSPADDSRLQMLELEVLQLSQNTDIERIIPSHVANASPLDVRRFAEVLADHPRASRALRQALGATTSSGVVRIAGQNALERLHLDHAIHPRLRRPMYRPIRVYAYDPSVGARLDTIDINEAVLRVPWEDVAPGPIGEYIEVIDVDPASKCCYAPVDLNHSFLLSQAGLAPSEANPQFHQQMAYAVAMKTIEYFEKALGRVALWAPHDIHGPDNIIRREYVQRLRIYPHALRAQNAYYSPERGALLLGYFQAASESSGSSISGETIFTALSHDIIAHETTHALLHGLRLRSIEPTNPDVLAFHEAFADIVALFQHFTLPEALRHQIAVTRGNLEQENLLGQLARQFGEATGRYGALRDYVGRIVRKKVSDADTESDSDDPEERNVWIRNKPKRTDYAAADEPHQRGAVLVAAVFDAFLQIYKRRKADLVRLASGGTGILPDGDIPVDLVNRLAREASKVAEQVLKMCIRALDYCPPDLTFGEYLRAIITADTDLVPDDKYGYRIAFVAAFRDRGIYPRDVKQMSPGSLLWEPPPLPLRSSNLKQILEQLSLRWSSNSPRKQVANSASEDARKFWHWLMDPALVSDEEIENLGLYRIAAPQPFTVGDVEGELRRIEVHSVRPARRVGPDGTIRSDVIIEITQSFRPKDRPGLRIRAGCTLLIDLDAFEIRYLLRKRLETYVKFQMAFGADRDFGLRANYFGDDGASEPFAVVHRVYG
jgi:hypothetical protein